MGFGAACRRAGAGDERHPPREPPAVTAGDALRCSIVLPAHNEADLLESCVRDVVKAMRDRDEPFEVLIVENGSIDGTVELAERIQAETPEVRLITLPNADYGAAV